MTKEERLKIIQKEDKDKKLDMLITYIAAMVSNSKITTRYTHSSIVNIAGDLVNFTLTKHSKDE